MSKTYREELEVTDLGASGSLGGLKVRLVSHSSDPAKFPYPQQIITLDLPREFGDALRIGSKLVLTLEG